MYLEGLRDLGSWAGPEGKGCVTLLGDAARTSMAGGGANSAFKDAIDFADALGGLGSPLSAEAVPHALRSYEEKAKMRLPAAKVLEGRDDLPSNIGADRSER